MYLVINKKTNKKYIGQTAKTIEERWNKHLSSVRLGSSLYFHKSLRKYGATNFSVEVLHECLTKEEMDFVEIFYIHLLGTKAPNGYNSTCGGEGTIGHKHSENSIQKMRESHKGFVVTEEHRRKLSRALIGKPKSVMHSLHISEGSKGIPRTVPAWNKGIKLEALNEAHKINIGKSLLRHYKENPNPVNWATCHPDRVVRSNGLCNQCYHHQYYLEHPEKYKTQKTQKTQNR